MILEPQTEHNAFQSLLESLFIQKGSADGLQKMRLKAWNHFLEMGLPTRETEVYRYLKLRNLFSQSYVQSYPTEVAPEAIAPYIYPECKESVIVFVNGHYQPKLSNLKALSKKAVVTTLDDAVHTFGAFLNNQWSKSLKEETDPLAILNTALHRDGVFVYLPPKTISVAPLQVLYVIDARDKPMIQFPRLNFFAGAHSQIDIVASQALISGKGYCVNQLTDIAIEEEGHIRYTQVACGEQSDVWHFDATRASLKRNSTFKTISVTDGAATVRQDYLVTLVGENAEALLNGVWMLEDKREAHTHVVIDHQAPHCRSMQLYKGVLNDFSRSSFEGKILVRQAAQKTDAFQLNNNLLLSERAIAYSKPNLEIFCDDVKASHGSTVGQLDKEQLFYMKTRGFFEEDAKNLLIYAYCKEVIDMIALPTLKKSISERAQRYLKRG